LVVERVNVVRVTEISWVNDPNISSIENLVIPSYLTSLIGEEWKPVFGRVENVREEDEIWKILTLGSDVDSSESDFGLSLDSA